MSSHHLSRSVQPVQTFRSAKAAHAILIKSDLVRVALIQATLDPEVLEISPALPPIWSSDVHPDCHFVLSHADGRVGVLVEEDRHSEIVEFPEGHLVQVIRPADLAVEPFAGNARLVWACAGRWYPASDQVRVLKYMDENGEVSLIEAAEAASASTDPIATVLALACRDLIELHLKDGPLGPGTRVARRLGR